MWFEDAPDGDITPIRVPASLTAALAITRRRHPRRSASCPAWSPTSPTRSASLGPRQLVAGRLRPLMIPPALGPRTLAGGAARSAVSTSSSTWPSTTRRRLLRRRAARAGRRGDFLTSPEVGPLFGAVLARPSTTLVGASSAAPTRSSWSRPAPGRARWPGRCCVAEPACAAGPRLRAGRAQRRAAGGRTPSTCPAGWASVDGAGLRRVRRVAEGRRGAGRSPRPPTCRPPVAGVVLANELLDNLPFRLAASTGGDGAEAAVGRSPTATASTARGRRPVDDEVAAALAGLGGCRPARGCPWQQPARRVARRRPRPDRSGSAASWSTTAATTAALAARPATSGCARTAPTSAAATRSTTPARRTSPARSRSTSSSSTVRPTRVRTQAELAARLTASTSWSTRARRIWAERAQRGDLAALRARSRVREAEALHRPRRPRRLRRPRVGRRPRTARAAARRDAVTSGTDPRVPGEPLPGGRPWPRADRSRDFASEDRTFPPPAGVPGRGAGGRRLALRRGRRRLRGLLGPPGPRAAHLVERLPHHPRVGAARSPSGSSAARSTCRYNCLDRHVAAGRGDKVAFHWEGEPGDTRTITYADLLDEVQPVRQRAQGPRRRAGRPRRHLHADDPRAAGRACSPAPASAPPTR